MKNSEQEIVHLQGNEFYVIQEESWGASTSDETFFTKGRTIELINLYKKYRVKVGTTEIKNMKRLWEIIVRDLSNLYKITTSATKCENRWKVLERNYKKVMDNNNRSGRGLKTFEFQMEFDEIYGKKKNIIPTILISSNNVISNCGNPSKIEQSAERPNTEDNPIINLESSETGVEKEVQIAIKETPKISSQKRKRSVKSVSQTYKRRNDILSEMKNDLKAYYEEKKTLEKEKVELNKKKLEDRIRRTALLETYIKNMCNV